MSPPSFRLKFNSVRPHPTCTLTGVWRSFASISPWYTFHLYVFTPLTPYQDAAPAKLTIDSKADKLVLYPSKVVLG